MTDPIDDAVAVLRRGGLVGMPTETVYGLAADASDEAAVRRIFTVKGRPADHPLIVHVAAADQLPAWCHEVPATAVALAATCWPGPLTLLVPKAEDVLAVVTGGRDTVGIRVPSHPVAQELLRRFGGGLAAPSANRFGHVSPTTADHVRADLGDDVDMVLDGGPSTIGVESTIVDCTVSPPQILRPGAITAEQIEQLLGLAAAETSGPSRASGMLSSHYAPRATVIAVESAAAAIAAADAQSARGEQVEVLDPTDDLVTAAHQLYSWLRDADDRGVTTIVAVLPAPAGLGAAIRDRLLKAAGLGSTRS
ncbi:MAG TPA: L-threonylcarbamoyladenylate synthase [Ilumatobacteraceae bacterium]|jgi:L-threonylcarbamoyladenylate synthase